MHHLIATLLVALEPLPVWRSRLGLVLRAWLGVGRRYGVRCFSGQTEKTGFVYRAEAEAWGREYYGANYIVFHYEPIDLRIAPSEFSGRARLAAGA